MSENETNEMPMREKMAKNTTGDMSVCGRSDRRRQQFPARASSLFLLLASCAAQMAFAATVNLQGRCDKSTRAADAIP